MNFFYFTILIIISDLTIGARCRGVTYNNADYYNHKIQNNQTRKLNEYRSKVQTEPDNVGKSLQNSAEILQLNKLDHKNRIRNPTQLLKYLKRYHIHKKNSPYTLAIFKDEKSKEKYPTHTMAIFKQNDANQSKGKFPSHTLAIFEPNPNSNRVVLSKPYKINLTGNQLTLPELDEDTREGEVFLNNAIFQDLFSNNENDNSYQVDDSLKQEYFTINENEINSYPSDDSSYFPDSYQTNDQYQDNFTGYPESHQLTSTTEQPDQFSGYFYQAPTYLPPSAENGVILLDSIDNVISNNDTKLVKVKENSLFAHYYIGYKFWNTCGEEISTIVAQDIVSISNKNLKLFLFILKATSYRVWELLNYDNELSIKSTGRRLFTLMTWNIPLYFNIYFIVYMSFLVIRSIARHKVKLPSIGNTT